MMKRALGLAALLCLLVLAGWWLAPRLLGPPSYVFLHLIESNTHGLARLPAGEFPAAAHFHADTGALWVPAAVGRKTPVLLLYELDSLGLRTYARLQGLRPGATVRLAEPRSWRGGPGGSEVIADGERLFRSDLSLQRVERDGTVHLEAGGGRVKLAPGQGWSWAVLEPGGRPVEAMPGPAWEQAVREAFAANRPLSRLTVVNYGRWDWSRVKVGEPR
ncbi:MAG TPA: hypothetical protein DCM14_02060 [Clostridiales bacterium UBA8153]|nr:hypothetical protein [Clostridiales bacterium UBA8153]